MRINKLLSNYGICSRKDANRIIEQERIYVNGKLCTKGMWVEEEDEIYLDGVKITPGEKVYIFLNKPRGITCTASKEVEGNIISYVNYPKYIFPVGRLDKESQGLILLTNDGELANGILESDNEHEKEYIVTVDKEYDEEFILNMKRGVDIGGIVTRQCKVDRVDKVTFKIVLTQGLNKQIRRMCKKFGYKVIRLERIRIMNVRLENIKYGEWIILKELYLKNDKLVYNV